MKEYIEKEAFKQHLRELKKQVNEIMPGQSVISGTTLSELIDRFPAADVVEVVRCKDCRYLTYSDMYGECGKALLGVVTPNDYCSHGERKEGAE